jgi:hypothetical protein
MSGDAWCVNECLSVYVMGDVCMSSVCVSSVRMNDS